MLARLLACLLLYPCERVCCFCCFVTSVAAADVVEPCCQTPLSNVAAAIVAVDVGIGAAGILAADVAVISNHYASAPIDNKQFG